MQIHHLLIGCKNKDPRSEFLFMDLYAERMLAHCKNNVTEPEDAEELVQDGFLKFFQTIDDFTLLSVEQLEAWLYTIMENLWKNHNKQQKKKRKLKIRRMADPPDQAQSPEVTDDINYQATLGLLDCLPFRLRQLFELFYYKQMTPVEVAKEMGTSVKTVYSQKSRLKDLVRDLLNPNNNNNEGSVAK